jgi:4-hydroxythreonine-4-phosphate dehydrogenase
MNDNRAKPIIGISIGDVNGVGLELIIKSFADAELLDLCTPVVFGSTKAASYHRNAIDMRDFNFNIIKDLSQIQHGKANLINVSDREVKIEFGEISAEAGALALASLEAACRALEDAKIHALVTAPIHKKSIQSDSFRFSGHTDYLEARFKSKALMILASDEMRMALATVHIPLREVSESLSEDLIFDRLQTLAKSLRNDFHLPKGKIAVLALNPHAGDQGVIGVEDQEMVLPAIERAKEAGIMAFGPFPADSFFGAQMHTKYDAVLAMYHDQGLIPFKTIAFGKGVNYSAGLPVIRTSPDHGTAFDIAGEGKADPSSFRQALYLAIDLIRNRGISSEINSNPLKIKGKKK